MRSARSPIVRWPAAAALVVGGGKECRSRSAVEGDAGGHGDRELVDAPRLTSQVTPGMSSLLRRLWSPISTTQRPAARWACTRLRDPGQGAPIHAPPRLDLKFGGTRCVFRTAMTSGGQSRTTLARQDSTPIQLREPTLGTRAWSLIWLGS